MYVSFTIFGELTRGVASRISSCESNFGSDLLNCCNFAFAISSGGGGRFWFSSASLFLFFKYVDDGGGGWGAVVILRSCFGAYDIFCVSVQPTGGGGGGGCKPLLRRAMLVLSGGSPGGGGGGGAGRLSTLVTLLCFKNSGGG